MFRFSNSFLYIICTSNRCFSCAPRYIGDLLLLLYNIRPITSFFFLFDNLSGLGKSIILFTIYRLSLYCPLNTISWNVQKSYFSYYKPTWLTFCIFGLFEMHLVSFQWFWQINMIVLQIAMD